MSTHCVDSVGTCPHTVRTCPHAVRTCPHAVWTCPHAVGIAVIKAHDATHGVNAGFENRKADDDRSYLAS